MMREIDAAFSECIPCAGIPHANKENDIETDVIFFAVTEEKMRTHFICIDIDHRALFSPDGQYFHMPVFPSVFHLSDFSQLVMQEISNGMAT